MKTLLRLCVAAVLVTAAAACSEMPTASKSEVSPVRRNGVTMGGGFDTASRDSTTINTVNGDQTTVLNSTCVEQRGGVIIGGGHYIGDPNCE